MKFNRATDYSIRLLTHLAVNKKSWVSRDLAGELHIPYNHISKVVNGLSRRGYILARKGKGGGIKLGMDPKKISLYSVIVGMEGPIVLSECVAHKEKCVFSGKCNFRKYLIKAGAKMIRMFKSMTIADLASV